MAITQGNLGVVKNNLQLYYNRESVKSFRGEATTNYVGVPCSNHNVGGVASYWVSTITSDTSTGYQAFKVVPLAGGYQYGGTWYSCGIIAGTGGYQPPGTYSLSAKVLLPKDSIFTFGFRAYPETEEFAVNVTGTGTWQTIKRENFTTSNYDFLQFQIVRSINGSMGSATPVFPGEPFWVRDVMINSGSYAKPFATVTNEVSERPENTTNITNNANFASSISGTDSGGTQNGWTFGSWSGSGNAYATQSSTVIYSSGSISYSAIPLRVTRTSAGSMDFFSSNWNTLTNGVVYTISFWARSNLTTTLDIVHQNLGTIKSYSIDPAAGWYKYTGKFTHAGGTQYPYLRHNGGNGTWIEIADVQLEAKSYRTDFTTTNRTSVANTYAGGGGLIDLSGNSANSDLTNVSFNSDGYYFTTAGNNYLNTSITTLPSNTQLTIDVWTKPTSTTQTKTLVSKWGSSGQSNFCFLLFLNWFAQGNIYFLVGNSAGTSYSTHSIPHNLSTSAYSNFTVVYDNGLVSWYRNGVFIQTDTNGNTPLKSVTTAITIGADYDGGNPDTLTRSYDGTIPNVKLYSRPLTAAEVLRNFESQRKVYAI